MGSTDSLPPRCSRNVRSLTFRTRTSGRAFSASVICRACSSPEVLQVTSTTIPSWWDSTMSSAVTAAPCSATAEASSLVALKLEPTSTRNVIEYPGLGLATASSSLPSRP